MRRVVEALATGLIVAAISFSGFLLGRGAHETFARWLWAGGTMAFVVYVDHFRDRAKRAEASAQLPGRAAR
jgi:hypothetical protein